MITIRELAMQYGPQLLYTNVNLDLMPGRRYGLVGANGTGKSTFLNTLAGLLEPSFGTITKTRGLSIGLLSQDQYKYEHQLVLDVVLQGNPALWHAMQTKYTLSGQALITQEQGYELANAEEVYLHYDGYSADLRATKLLTGLGILEEYHVEPMSKLSGGFKLRVLLAQLLFSDPDVLLLDEPTNHLDINTIGWLEQYLIKEVRGVLIFISHDQEFLNNVSTHILDIDYGEIRAYVGNYDEFVRQKQIIVEQKQHALKDIEKKVAQMKIFIERFRASASRSKQALSREKQLDKIEMPDIKHSSRVHPNFQFTQQRPAGAVVLTIKNISKAYNGRSVITHFSTTINRAQKVLIIGPNGIGKSTLLKIITGTIPADSGTYQWGYETHYSYIAQDHHEQLKGESTVSAWLASQATSANDQQLRSTLGAVLFSKDAIYKSISALSGGEAARLLIARAMLAKPNIIILDEPTNHLDLEARESLAQALNAFAGTIILVTHDRHFAAQVATRVIALTPEKVIDYQGTYAEYLEYSGADFLRKN